MRLEVKYHDEKMPKLEVLSVGDFVDLVVVPDMGKKEFIILHSGEYRLLSLGVSIKLPINHHAEVVPRSSTFKRYGILQTNSVGIIDNSYCGDDDVWRFPAYATRDVAIPAYSRIAQFRVVRNMPRLEIAEVESLGFLNRGGFGSTGV